MKLNYTTGCICDSLTVDDIETIDMETAELKNIVKQLFDREQDKIVIQHYFDCLVESQGQMDEWAFNKENPLGYVTVHSIIFQKRKDKYDVYGEKSVVLIDVGYSNNVIRIVNERQWDGEINEEIRETICRLIDTEDDITTLQDLFMKSLESQGKPHDLGHCECCGDWIVSYDLTI